MESPFELKGLSFCLLSRRIVRAPHLHIYAIMKKCIEMKHMDLLLAEVRI